MDLPNAFRPPGFDGSHLFSYVCVNRSLRLQMTWVAINKTFSGHAKKEKTCLSLIEAWFFGVWLPLCCLLLLLLLASSCYYLLSSVEGFLIEGFFQFPHHHLILLFSRRFSTQSGAVSRKWEMPMQCLSTCSFPRETREEKLWPIGIYFCLNFGKLWQKFDWVWSRENGVRLLVYMWAMQSSILLHLAKTYGSGKLVL